MSFEPAPPASPETLALTPAEATAKLQQMQEALHPPPPPNPTDAQGARQLLDKLTKDSSWAAALVRGDPQANKQFADLTKMVADADDVRDRLAGIVEPETGTPIFETTIDGQWPRRVVAEVVTDLTAAGLDPGSVEMAINGGTVSAAEFRAAQALQSTLHSDPNWRERFLANDYTAKKQQLLLSVILSCEIAEPK
jgi:hypothetical protein